MITSSAQAFVIFRQTANGRPSIGKTLSDFAISFRLSGALQAITPTIAEGTTVGAWRSYVVSFTAPPTTGTLEMIAEPARGTDVVAAGIHADDVTTYSIDTLAGVFASAGASPVSILSTSTSRTLYDGDSIVVDIVVPGAALTALGVASLSAIDTLTAGAKLRSKNSDDPADATLSTAILSDVTGNRVVRCSLNAFPAVFAVPDATQQVLARVDLRATEGSRTFIVGSCDLTFVWKATTA